MGTSSSINNNDIIKQQKSDHFIMLLKNGLEFRLEKKHFDQIHKYTNNYNFIDKISVQALLTKEVSQSINLMHLINVSYYLTNISHNNNLLIVSLFMSLGSRFLSRQYNSGIEAITRLKAQIAPLNDDEILNIAKLYGNSSFELSEAILSISLQRGSTDNISVISIKLL